MANTILAGSDPQAIYENHKIDEQVYPGQFLEFRTGGVHIHDTASSATRRAIVLENSFGGDLNTPYANGDSVRYGVFAPGAQVRVRIKARAAAIAQYGELSIAADGYPVAKASGGSVVSIGIALEAVDNSSSTTDTFMLVELK